MAKLIRPQQTHRFILFGNRAKVESISAAELVISDAVDWAWLVTCEPDRIYDWLRAAPSLDLPRVVVM